MSLCFRGPVLGLVLLLAGCAALEPDRSGPYDLEPGATPGRRPATIESRPAPVTPQPRAEPATPAPASGNLIDQAIVARVNGDFEQALSLLERAQRIQPDDGRVYLELARTHADRGDTARARATAERGLLYCWGADCAALKALAN